MTVRPGGDLAATTAGVQMRQEKGIGKACDMGTCSAPNATFSVRPGKAH